METKFSVLITNFNYENYVVDAVESALKQTQEPAEIIVVDDGSTDGSVSLLQEKYGTNQKIKILSQTNSGQLAAFSRGLAAATGDFVAFLDADDWWDESYLEKLLKILGERAEVDVVLTSLRVIGASDPGSCFHAGSLYGKKIYSGVLSCWVSNRGHNRGWLGSATSGICAKRSTVRLALPPNEYFLDWVTSADNPLIFGLAINGAVFEFANEPSVNYRVHKRNNWFGRSTKAAQNFKNELRHQRLFSYFRTRVFGSDRPTPQLVALEYLSSAGSDVFHFLEYLGYCFAASGTFAGKIRCARILSRRYVKILLMHRRANKGRWLERR